ncbi:MAG: HD domain-containing protein [Deltaproteobacteria bacterium]|nr:HD domain-containing protein [Deltaproteobacteria bacterium]
MDDRDKTIENLKAELARAAERERDYRDARTAMLYMLEDLNKTTEAVAVAGKTWEATFDAITDPLYIHDSGYNIVRANTAYAEAAGRQFNEFIGRPYYTVFPEGHGPFAGCVGITEGREAAAAAEEITVPAIGRVYKVRYYSVDAANGTKASHVHILDDVTKERAAEKRLMAEVDITTSLLSIAEASSSVKDVEKLMEAVVGALSHVVRADVCLSYIIPPGAKGLRPSHAFGLPNAVLPSFRTEELDTGAWFIRKAVESKETVVAHAPFAGPDNAPLTLFGWAGQRETMLVIPLASRVGPIGVIICLYRRRREFSEEDMLVIWGGAHQISASVEAARLYAESIAKAIELSHTVETVKVMHEIDRNMLSTLDAAQILDTVIRLLAKLVPCDRATVAMVDRARGGFVYQAGFGIGLPKGTLTPFADTTASRALETGASEFTANLSEEAALPPIEARLLAEGFLSHIRVPIEVRGEITAILSVGAKRVGVFTAETLSTLNNLAYQIGVAMQNAQLVADLHELFYSTVKTLSNTIDAKSPWTMGHSERVTQNAVRIAAAMGFNEKDVKTIELAGLLHDIGKLGTYEGILNKPGKLTDGETTLMKQHPGRGALIIEPIRQLKDIVPGIKYHHEYYDGTGYPEGLKGEAIPLMARILAVADTVDAMGADRPYRKGRPMDAIVAELKRCSGTQFDPKVVDAFLGTLGGAGKG